MILNSAKEKEQQEPLEGLKRVSACFNPIHEMGKSAAEGLTKLESGVGVLFVFRFREKDFSTPPFGLHSK